ncbi:MAG TPA: DUF3141 domain-containing protein, partial [Sphingomicrobium sp.]|nr:DUF3141 domain-containing protein [Sphingomicrobium sp.]
GTVGHLGIFVSGKVATREHDEFTSAMDMIDLMPPGLYEAVIEEIDAGEAHRELIGGDYLFRLVPRTLDDIRALGGNSPEDDLKFAAVDRVSNINRRLYEQYLGPLVRSVTPPGFGDWARKMHPNRVRVSIFSDENPGMRLVAETAEQVRKDRRPVEQDNFFAAAEKSMASTISASLSAFGAARDAMTEQLFHMTYGSPVLQALVGLDPKDEASRRKPERDALREQVQAGKRQELEAKFETGGAVEAALRSIAYVRMGEGSADERGFAVIKQLHDAQPPGRPRSMEQLKEVVREQYLLLKIDEKRAVAAIPKLIPRDPDDREKTLRAIQRIISAAGAPTGKAKRRLAEIESMFGAKAPKASKKEDRDVRA